MNITCNIIRDLLPLYAEGMVSDDSREAVEEHICGCAPCRDLLAELRTETVMPPQTDTASLAHLERNIRRRRTGAAVLAILITAAVLFSIFNYLHSPVYLSAEEAIAGVTEKRDTVIVELSPQVSYCRWQNDVDPETGRRSMTFIAARHRWNVLMDGVFGPETKADDSRKMHLSADKDIWYASTGSGEEDTLLCGVEPSGGRMSLPRLVLGYYLLMAMALGILLAVPALLLRKKKPGKLIGAGAVLCLSFALSDLITTGGNWRIYDGFDVPILLTLMLIQTVLLTAAVLWGFHVLETGRGE